MKERPIIMQAESVRAILDGRKTQDRRVAKLTDSGRVKAVGSCRNWHLDDPNAALACPHGQPGDRLWVRETWSDYWLREGYGGVIDYKATWRPEKADTPPWKSPLFMPLWASRITLELVYVRVERVQDISEADAECEGVETATPQEATGASHKVAYRMLWNSIQGKNPARMWEANPWVWVLEFKRVTP